MQSHRPSELTLILLKQLSLGLALTLQLSCDSSGGRAQDGGEPSGGAAEGGQEVDDPRPLARFSLTALPAEGSLGELPFPHDVYLSSDGHLKLSPVFPNASGVLSKLINALERDTVGFGTTSGHFISFDQPIDLSLLPPDGGATLREDATISLIDIDEGSPEYGRRWPIIWRFNEEETPFSPAHTLSVRLLEGLALRPKTTYALVVTESIAKPSADFQACLSEDQPSEEPLASLWSICAPLRAWSSERPNSATPIAVASVFTTQDPVSELFKIRDFIHTLPAPTPREIMSVGVQQARTHYELFRGRYTAPRFQEGEIPYKAAGGGIKFDSEGAPIVQGEEDLRFSLAVPVDDELPMPSGGWPVVLYAHGTGGNYESYFRGDIAISLARQGLAVISIDQIHHGERDGGLCDGPVDYSQCVSLLFFNFIVPEAGRDNVRQSALDYVSLLRLVGQLDISTEQSEAGKAVRLNPDKVMFMGHSQGGLNGPLFLAIEPLALGAVFSGAGSNIAISLEQKTRPFNVNQLVKLALGLIGDEPLDRWHPTLTLLQTYIEPGDSANYGRFWFREPPEGHKPKSVFMTVGLQDEYTPPETTFALAASGGVPLMEPIYTPVETLDFLGIESAGVPPYAANVAEGQATAGLAQFESLGHFVIFESPSAKERYGKFLKELADRAVPRIY